MAQSEHAHLVQHVEMHHFYGDNSVSTAHQFLAKLPNGWQLVSLVWDPSMKAWVAKVQDRRDHVH